MCAFIMRTTCPNANNPWYTHTSRGGKSPCIHDGSLQYCEWPGSTIRNCVGYAWGRFSEILGQPMSNSGAPNAGMWFSQYATNYERGQTPRVGAVGCFDNPGKAGHVLIVEQVYPDGSILTSESGYSSSQPFWNQRRYPPNYMSGSYKFQGFIYNPNASGGTGEEINTPGGILEIDPRDLSMFTDFTGFDLRARLGDIVYEELLSLGLIKLIRIGNHMQEMLKTDQINKYIYSNMYKSYNTRNDALGREASYWDMSSMKPSIVSTGYQLSAMNYTPLLEDVWSNVREKFTYYQMVDEYGNAVSNKFGKDLDQPVLDSGYVPTTIATNLSGLEASPRNVIEFFMKKGMCAAVGCGIAGNIKAESNFRTNAVGDNGTSFGICQWHNNRGTAMKSFCQNYGGDWNINLTGQLEYLWWELCNNKGYGLSDLRTIYNSLEGAKKAADIFVRKFERPKNVDNASIKRQANAETYWNTIVRYL